MEAKLAVDQRIAVAPAVAVGEVAVEGSVTELSPLVVVTLDRQVPLWLQSGTEILIAGAQDDGLYRWPATVDTIDLEQRLARLRDVGAGSRVERRHAPRFEAPHDVEWATLAGAERGIGVGRDLSRLGLRFVPLGEEPPPVDTRLVVAVHLPAGAVTAFGRILGEDGISCRLVFDRLHPESAHRLAHWEAEQTRADLAAQLGDMVRDDPSPPDSEDALAVDQPS